ncbi:MAG TPA: CCC motif membrane protein [Flavobacterium sp.]|nr:CCC motif membrane protein [Flavobacterium sp.]
MKKHLPNATAVLILGILSIISCCFYGVGVIFAIIALVLANSDMKLYRQDPESYLNYQNLNIGRILSIIGMVFSMVMLVFCIYLLSLGPQGIKDFEENLRLKSEQMENEE